jgi:hypothetical protein
VVTLALISSYFIIFDQSQITSFKDLFILVSHPLIFLVAVLLFISICFYLVTYIYGIFNPDQVELGAKVLGVELKTKIIQNAEDALNHIEEQFTYLGKLGNAINNYLITPFENDLIKGPDIYDNVRREIFKILKSVYTPETDIEVYVIPLVEREIMGLNDNLIAVVKEYDKNVDKIDIDKSKKIGIGVFYGDEQSQNQDTAIIIDYSRKKFNIVLAEIITACNLFISVSTIVDIKKMVNVAKNP